MNKTKVDLVEHILEPLVDKHGLTHILVSLELLCEEKSAHIDNNWQDRGLARDWNKAAGFILAAAKKVEQLSI